ncbi:hypothetical protein EDB92DRAFT_1561920 [Lactarius akahatsu]|uniref:Uncharacterized protein n=1 Tax=Lactarius akahatsu TaxID=416441 RepID=A0AAD4LCY1_9AGAM|nr:hypothetical protein EDB92DRAFT_1561920 [Lactarius akahatsu]
MSVEVVIPLPTKHARAQAVSPHRKGRRHPHTPNSPRRKQQRVVDEQEQDDSDGSIIVDAPRKRRRVAKTRLPDHSLDIGPVVLPCSIAHQPRPPYEQSSPFTPPDVNSLAGLPLTIPSEPARTEIAIPPRCTRRPILQILCANCERGSSTRSARVFVMRGQRLARSPRNLSRCRTSPPARTVALVPPLLTLPRQPIPMICTTRVWILASRPGARMRTQMRMG